MWSRCAAGRKRASAEVRARCEREPQAAAPGPRLCAVCHHRRGGGSLLPHSGRLEDELDGIEQRIFAPEGAPRDNIEALYALKQRLMVMKHAVAPLLEGVSNLSGAPCSRAVRENHANIFAISMTICSGLNQTADSIRDTIATAISVNLSMVTLQENETMKRLAAYAALLAVPTMIAGIYGMNFEHMPELKWRYGYATLVALHGSHRRAALFSLQKSQVAVAAHNMRRIGILSGAADRHRWPSALLLSAGLPLRAGNAYAFAHRLRAHVAAESAHRARLPRILRTTRPPLVALRGGRIHGAVLARRRPGAARATLGLGAANRDFFRGRARPCGHALPRWRNPAFALIAYALVLRWCMPDRSN